MVNVQPSPIHDLTGRRRGWTSVLIHLGERTEVASRLIREARHRQWHLISLDKFHGQMPADLTARGAIVDLLPTAPLVGEMLDRGIPVVRVGRFPHPDDAVVPAVMPDRLACGRLAAEHFAERGFAHVGFVGREPWGAFHNTYEVFAARAAELGCTCHLVRTVLTPEVQLQPDEEPDVARWRARQQQFTRQLGALPKPVALLSVSDINADRHCYWVTEDGLRVPEDVAVMGIGNDELICECAPVPISSIAHDTDGIAESAAQLLAQLMEGQAPEQTTVQIPPLGVVTRHSTDVLAASDPRVVEALRFMWDHVSENLAVEDIARHIGVARRTLEKAFRRDLRRGINAELQRRRQEKAREMLATTDLPVGEIARLLSFSGHKYFCEAFNAATGMSPTRYRRQAHTQPALGRRG